MAGVVHVPWYATGFRADSLASALAGVTPAALRYGASWYGVHRSRDDRYKFVQMIEFEDKADWERFWNGPEMTEFRVLTSSWYQVPVLYYWNDVVATGALNGNGANGAPHTVGAAEEA